MIVELFWKKIFLFININKEGKFDLEKIYGYFVGMKKIVFEEYCGGCLNI